MFNFGFQGSVTPIMEGIIDLHNHIFFFLVLIFVFVFWIFVNILYRFWWKLRSPANRVSLGTLRHLSHNTVLEVVWTVFPSFILVAIAVPSFALLYAMDEVLEPTLTLKAVGHQWYWSYQYSNCLPTPVRMVEHPDLVPRSLWESLIVEGEMLKSAVLEHNGRHIPTEGINVPPAKLMAEFGTPYPRLRNFRKDEIQYFRDVLNMTMWQPFSAAPEEYTHSWIALRLQESFIEYFRRPYDLAGGISPIPTVEFDSYMVAEDDLQAGDYRLLEVDEPVVLPANTHIRLLITGEDVIHSFAIPQMGVKVDAIPGRLNQQGIYIKRLGTFYGQCSEICGVNHGFMPIVVHSVEMTDFIHWYISKLHSQQPQMDLEMYDPEQVFFFLHSGKVKYFPALELYIRDNLIDATESKDLFFIFYKG